MNVLYVTNYRYYQDSMPNSGTLQIEYRNKKCIETLQNRGINFVYFDTPISFFDNLFLRSTPQVIRDISKQLDSGLYTHIYFSHSFYGRIAEYVKKRYPHIIIVTFFHNVEYPHHNDRKKVNGISSLLNKCIQLCSLKQNEKKSCKYSDTIIVLNKRDSNDIKRIYGRAADYIIPTSLDDLYNKEKAQITNHKDLNYLFIGSNFYANVRGLQWFISNVMPHIKGKLYIVGTGMDEVKFKDIDPERVTIIGYVEDLSTYYYDADIVINPILSGSGMKTKTAEAMMYGKTIVGTRESFEGYDIDNENIYECNSSEAFIETLNRLNSTGAISRFNQGVRDIFLRSYTLDSALAQFRQVFKQESNNLQIKN